MASFDDFRRKMAAEHLPQTAIDTFRHYYAQLVKGETGHIPERDIEPPGGPDVIAYDTLTPHASHGVRALEHAAVIKLNGGLGTSMGLQTAKSLIRAKDGLTFLDCAALQVRSLRERYGIRVPFVLMNSFSTDRDSQRALARHEGLDSDIPPRFLQHKFPKVMHEGFSPAEWPHAPSLEWNPPGHGDLYPALVSSGMLDRMLERRIRYVFVSNSDNLGADLDPAILGYFAESNAAFLMEVAERTSMDRKGGHLARHRDGHLVLRESAQCAEEDAEAFQNIERYRYFNTNNLWIDLVQLSDALRAHGGILPLPLIVNPKQLDPRDPASPPVYQLETAMGAAVALFDTAVAVVVPRTRFCPVKKCDDLLTVRSDRYLLTDTHRVVPNPRATGHIAVDLDKRYFGILDDFEKRFSNGPPSLTACESLTVRGPVSFGRNVCVQGVVRIENTGSSEAHVEDGSELRDRALAFDD